MFIVTDVAPYPHGPAGVHGVLPQAATALAELAGLASLDAVRVGAVPDGRPGRAGRRAASWRCSRSARRRGPTAQRAAIIDGVRSGRLGILGVHAATDACASWEEYGSLVGARFDGHPWTETFDIDVVDVAHPSTAPSRGARGGGTTRCTSSATCDPTPGCCCAWPRASSTWAVPGARRPSIGFPLAWCFTEGSRARLLHARSGTSPGRGRPPTTSRHLQGGLAWVLGDDGRTEAAPTGDDAPRRHGRGRARATCEDYLDVVREPGRWRS